LSRRAELVRGRNKCGFNVFPKLSRSESFDRWTRRVSRHGFFKVSNSFFVGRHETFVPKVRDGFARVEGAPIRGEQIAL
jgi:hypothetical protein